MKVLVVEYITGGGFNTNDLPGHLADEGLLMLEALLKSLQAVDGIELAGMIDQRLVGRVSIHLKHCKIIERSHSFEGEFNQLLKNYDAVWLVAPETDGILQTLSAMVERSGKILLASSSSAVAIAGNKWLTFKQLRQYSIPCVETCLLQDFSYTRGEWMVKSIDGVGCENSIIIRDARSFDQVIAQQSDKGRFIVQPHLDGAKTSLSGLCKNGRSWLICANNQHFQMSVEQYRLEGITVNFTPELSGYRALFDNIAQAMPALWGYVGVDLIETRDGIQVLEVNPRLTTSFVAIDAACGINCAKSVLDLLAGEPALQPDNSRPVYINILN